MTAAAEAALAGPVLEATPLGRAVAEAILDDSTGATLVDRGGYLRVSAPGGCRVTRASVEAHAGRAIDLRALLERVMPSFQGALTIGADAAAWRPHAGAGGES